MSDDAPADIEALTHMLRQLPNAEMCGNCQHTQVMIDPFRIGEAAADAFALQAERIEGLDAALDWALDSLVVRYWPGPEWFTVDRPGAPDRFGRVGWARLNGSDWLAPEIIRSRFEDRLRSLAAVPEKETCTGMTAQWCPVCGDCTYENSERRNDQRCVLHSDESAHAAPEKENNDG